MLNRTNGPSLKRGQGRQTVRNISFKLTTRQVRDRSKDVTRRLGWLDLVAGQELRACVQCQGLRKGQRIEELAIIRVVSVQREPLRRMTDDVEYGFEEIRREGFADDPNLQWPSVWVPWFCGSHRGCTPESEVTRIEFAYVVNNNRVNS